jgi:hypothetical protein
MNQPRATRIKTIRHIPRIAWEFAATCTTPLAIWTKRRSFRFQKATYHFRESKCARSRIAGPPSAATPRLLRVAESWEECAADEWSSCAIAKNAARPQHGGRRSTKGSEGTVVCEWRKPAIRIRNRQFQRPLYSDAGAGSIRAIRFCMGRRMVNVSPFPSLDARSISPPCSRTMRRTISNPSPVPLSFVVK